jgi:hypothetical protein
MPGVSTSGIFFNSPFLNNMKKTATKKRVWHPVHAHTDGVFDTATVKIDLLNPTQAMISIDDIATSLSKICRFGGHTSAFYSVAQHSVIMAAMAPDSLKKEALLHDAPEAYLGDVIKPLKNILGSAYSDLETRFDSVIRKRFKLPLQAVNNAIIKELEAELVDIEQSALVKGDMELWSRFLSRLNLHHPDYCIWSWELSEAMFMQAFRKYFNAKSPKK